MRCAMHGRSLSASPWRTRRRTGCWRWRMTGAAWSSGRSCYAREGFGLTSMRQRASAIGGEWQIESQPGAGTRVSVRLPKRKAAA